MEGLAIDAWLEPLDDGACGEDLEYDPGFLELELAVAGKPETQFAAAEPPQWPIVRELAEGLLARSRDLRLALTWGRAALNLEGFAALAPALNLFHGLLDRYWDNLHPRNDPEDGDPFARLSVLGSLDKLDGFLGDVRQCLLLSDRRLGGLRVREVEIALDGLAPREGESARTATQIQGMLGDLPELAEQLRMHVTASRDATQKLQGLMNDRFGLENTVDLKSLRGMIESVAEVLPAADGADGTAQANDELAAAGEDDGPRRSAGGGGLQRIESRQDAIKAINLICAYLEKSEPTNPAQLLLRRAERLIDKNFLQLVRDLAPEAVSEVARIMGIAPEASDE